MQAAPKHEPACCSAAELLGKDCHGAGRLVVQSDRMLMSHYAHVLLHLSESRQTHQSTVLLHLGTCSRPNEDPAMLHAGDTRRHQT